MFLMLRPWLYHLVVPAGLGLVIGIAVGMPDYLSGVIEVQELQRRIIKPIVSLYLAWALMLPLSGLVIASLASKNVPLILRLLTATTLGALPLSFIVPEVTLALGLEAQPVVGDTIAFETVQKLVIIRFGVFWVALSIVWIGANYHWYEKRAATTKIHAGIQGESSDKSSLSPQPSPFKSSSPLSSPPQFLSRLQKPIGTNIWALKAEQHYLRVYTELGEDLIHYGFNHAVQEMKSRDGMRVHRSYWIATDAVETVVKVQKSYALILKNKLRVPVSRTFKEQVESAGFMPADPKRENPRKLSGSPPD